MLFKVVLKLSQIYVLMMISKLYHLLEVMLQESIFTRLLQHMARELRLIWELRITLSLCPMLIKKTLLMLLSELVSDHLVKDAWQFQ